MWLSQLMPTLHKEIDWAALLPAKLESGSHPIQPLAKAISEQLQSGQAPAAILEQMRPAISQVPEVAVGPYTRAMDALIIALQNDPSHPPSDYTLFIRVARTAPGFDFSIQTPVQTKPAAQFSDQLLMAEIQMVEPRMPPPPTLPTFDQKPVQPISNFIQYADAKWSPTFLLTLDPHLVAAEPSTQTQGPVLQSEHADAYVVIEPSIYKMGFKRDLYTQTLQSMANQGTRLWVDHLNDNSSVTFDEFANALLHNLRNGRLPPSNNIVYVSDYASGNMHQQLHEMADSKTAQALLAECKKRGITLSFAGVSWNQATCSESLDEATKRNEGEIQSCIQLAKATGGHLATVKGIIDPSKGWNNYSVSADEAQKGLLSVINALPRTTEQAAASASSIVFDTEFSKSILSYVQANHPQLPMEKELVPLSNSEVGAFIAKTAGPDLMQSILERAIPPENSVAGGVRLRPLHASRAVVPSWDAALLAQRSEKLARALSILPGGDVNALGERYLAHTRYDQILSPRAVTTQKTFDCEEGSLRMAYLLVHAGYEPSQIHIMMGTPQSGKLGHAFLLVDEINTGKCEIIDVADAKESFVRVPRESAEAAVRSHMASVLGAPPKNLDNFNAENYYQFLAAHSMLVP